MSEKENNRLSYSWLLIFVFFILLSIYWLSASTTNKVVIIKDRGWTVVKSKQEEWKKVAPAFLSDSRQFLDQSQSSVDKMIEDEINNIFTPVYGGIDKYIDFHYGLVGSHVETATMIAMQTKLLSKDNNDITRILFKETGFNNKLEIAFKNISQGSQAALVSVFYKIQSNLKKTIGFSNEDMKIIIPDLKIDATELEEHYNINARLARVGITVVGAAALYKASKFLMQKLAKKVAARSGAVVGGRIAGALAGVKYCSWSFVSAAVCGAFMYIVTDTAVRNVDRLLNEDELRKELRNMVDSAKKEFIVKAKEKYSDIIYEVKKNNKNSVKKSLRLIDHIQ